MSIGMTTEKRLEVEAEVAQIRTEMGYLDILERIRFNTDQMHRLISSEDDDEEMVKWYAGRLRELNEEGKAIAVRLFEAPTILFAQAA